MKDTYRMTGKDYRQAILGVRVQVEEARDCLRREMERADTWQNKDLRIMGITDDPRFKELLRLYDSMGRTVRLADEMYDEALVEVTTRGGGSNG